MCWGPVCRNRPLQTVWIPEFFCSCTFMSTSVRLITSCMVPSQSHSLGVACVPFTTFASLTSAVNRTLTPIEDPQRNDQTCEPQSLSLLNLAPPLLLRLLSLCTPVTLDFPPTSDKPAFPTSVAFVPILSSTFQSSNPSLVSPKRNCTISYCITRCFRVRNRPYSMFPTREPSASLQSICWLKLIGHVSCAAVHADTDSTPVSLFSESLDRGRLTT